MRRIALLLALLLIPLAPSARAIDPPGVTMTIQVEADHHETMTLAFTGLERLARYTDLCLPLGAKVTGARDSIGAAQYDEKVDAAGRDSISFTARDTQLSIDMTRGTPPNGESAPFFENNANFCVPEGSALAIIVKMPADHTLFFLNHGGQIAANGTSGRIDSVGPVHAFYSYEAPLPTTAVVVSEGPFRVVVATEREKEAREVARDATPALAAALREAGLSMPAAQLRVLYSPQAGASWEAGHYDGRGLITIRASSLAPDATLGYPYVPTKVLVHESFHAASAWSGRGDVTDAIDWFLEGGARHAESFVDQALPNATFYCEKSSSRVQCWSFDDRISAKQLASVYGGADAFRASWDPAAAQSDDERQLSYAYSGYVVGAYVLRDGASSYQKAWHEIGAAFADGSGCPCGAGWLVGVLANATSGRETKATVLSPWADLTPDARLAAAKPLVQDASGMQSVLDAASHPFTIPGPAIWALVGAASLAALTARRRA